MEMLELVVMQGWLNMTVHGYVWIGPVDWMSGAVAGPRSKQTENQENLHPMSTREPSIS